MFLTYPSDTPFGNLNLAAYELIVRVDFINVRLQELYEKWEKFEEAHKGGFPDQRGHPFVRQDGILPHDVPWLRLRIEEIVYWIRKTTDTLIALSWMLGEHLQTGSFPCRLDADSIHAVLGRLECSSQPVHIELFWPHRPTLSPINDVSNTYKHHFVNHETVGVYGELGPTAYWISMRMNDSRSPAQFKGILLSDIVAGFGRLLTDVRAAHQQWLGAGKST